MLVTTLIWLHRWLTLLLLPLLLFLIVTGGILALQPVVKDAVSGLALERPVPVAELDGLLRQVDGNRVRALRFEDPAVAVLEFVQAGVRETRVFDLASGRDLGARSEGADFFHWIGELHKHFFWGQHWLIDVATYALVVIVLAGPWLAWPRLRNTAIGWHMGLGWVFGPLVGLVAVTAALLLLSIGTGGFPQGDRLADRFPLPPAIEAAARDGGLSHITSVDTVQHGSAVVIAGLAHGAPVTLVATRDGVTAIAAYPRLMDRLHAGTWAGGWSGALYLAAMLAMLGLTGTGLWSWARRQRGARARTGDADADVLVAWGSQTGTAAGLGAATVAALQQGGARVAGASLGALSMGAFARYREVFVIVSTTGDGDLPETARAFHAALKGANLGAQRFALLALGDSSYRQFCAAGLTLRAALLEAGAQEVLPVVKADRDPAGAWKGWLADVGTRLAVKPAAVAAPEGDRPVTLTLRRRDQLNNPADPDTQEVWALTLTSAMSMTWQPGDLLLVSPGPGEPERPYSIGSSPLEGDRTLALTVSLALQHTPDGIRYGRASHLLCRGLAEGDQVEARMRRHPNFHLPENPDRSVIMVATGCGVAPFPGFLAHKAAGGHRGPMWLFFGTQKRAADYFHGQRLEDWHCAGVLDRFDPAFNLDPGGCFIQDRMVARGADVLDWLTHRDAVLYACGRRVTVGEGVRSALRTILATHAGLDPEAAETRIAGWQAEGRLRFDLTD